MEATALIPRGGIIGLPQIRRKGCKYLRQRIKAGAKGLQKGRPETPQISVQTAAALLRKVWVMSASLHSRAQQDSGVQDAKLSEYTVKRGDTLSDLSRRYGLPVEHLANLNQLKDPDLIHAGSQILVASPNQSAEEISQQVCPPGGDGPGGVRWGVRIKGVRERRVVGKKVTSAQDALKRESLPAATPSHHVQSTIVNQASPDMRYQMGEALWLPSGHKLRTRAYTVRVNVTDRPRLPTRTASQWASMGALLLMVAVLSFTLRVGGVRIWRAYVSAWSHIVERKAAQKQRRADLEAAKKAEAQRRKKWWRSVVEDDRKAAQLAPDAINGSVRSRLPSEPSIGKQARELEQKRLEEEYNMFIRKIKVKDKDDGLIG